MRKKHEAFKNIRTKDGRENFRYFLFEIDRGVTSDIIIHKEKQIIIDEYEYMLNKKAALSKGSKKQYAIKDRKNNPFNNIGIIDRESYFPHVWRERIGKSFTKAEKAELEKYFNEKVQSEYDKVLNDPKLYNDWVNEIERSFKRIKWRISRI